MLWIFILIFTAASFFEAVSLAGKKQWRESAAITVLTLLSASFGILKILDIPTPIIILKNLFYPLGRMVFRNH